MSRTVWVVGSGGREHALALALLETAQASLEVVLVPGRASMGLPRQALDLEPGSFARAAADNEVDLVVVGPEAPLVAGLADALRARSVPVLGPSKAAARLEGSKAFAKAMMHRAGVPTAAYVRCETASEAKEAARRFEMGAVIKADGLAAGKGVVVADSLDEADRAIDHMAAGAHGEAGHILVVEERLRGEELSVIGLCDGRRLSLLPPSQDHKRLLEGDLGPNTGGMGAYAPAPLGSQALLEAVHHTCMQPVVDALAADGMPLVGVLYAGIMVTESGPKVLEYNVRFGDPEAQAILPLIDEPLFEVFMSAATGHLPSRQLKVKPGSACTVVLASAGYPVAPRKGDRIQGVDKAAAQPGIRVYHAGTELEEGNLVTAGGRVLGVTGLGEDLREAAKRAYEGADSIHFEGMQMRRDIGHRSLGAPGADRPGLS